ncbi:MAG: Uma2 family endonuclease [Anaerolineae bacterium]
MAIRVPAGVHIAPEEVIYPDSDGQGMPDGDPQRKTMIALLDILGERFRDDPDVYVSGNIFVYYEKGNRAAVFSPNILVVKGVAKKDRPMYKLWEENYKAPDFVLEIAAPTTYKEDTGPKKGLYALLGIREYFLYDRTGEFLWPQLQGYRLVGREYVPVGGEWPRSEVLGIEFRLEDGRLRLYDVETGERLLTREERLEQEAAARREAEAEVELLRAELARLKGD